MATLFEPPDLEPQDAEVLADIDRMQAALGQALRRRHRWVSGLRRITQARAIQGSTAIAGYDVSDEDALSAVDGEEPLTADEHTWAAVLGYRRVLNYALELAARPGFRLDAHTVRSMHFMMLEHDLPLGPGTYRSTEDRQVHEVGEDREVPGVGEQAVREPAAHAEAAYPTPDPDSIAGLMDALAATLTVRADAAPLVQAAMAHLNVIMIRPFRDGNARLARALQTVVLAHAQTPEPLFAGVDEWLGDHSQDYAVALEVSGADSSDPRRATGQWVRFSLRAHHLQAQTVRRRLEAAATLGAEIERLLADRSLPARSFDPVFDATLGLRVRRPGYVRRSGVEERTATRDLRALVDAGLLSAYGNTRGRYYVAAGQAHRLAAEARRRRPPVADPYPDLMDRLRAQARRPRPRPDPTA